MKVYAIRHGLTELNKKGMINGDLETSLAPEGIEQAKEAASAMPKSIKRIYSSPLLRAKQTAEILGSKLDLPVTFHDELKEASSRSRILKFLADVKAENADDEALLVTHSGVIYLMYLLEQGVPADAISNMSLHSFDLDKIIK
jgi:broad specificity phosphatase PhoE